MTDRTFSKQRHGPEAQAFFATEAAGLAWLDVPGGPAVPRVESLGAGSITMQRVDTGPASDASAERFGRELSMLHAAGAPAFGSAPPQAPLDHGWIGDAPMTYAEHESFAPFWAFERVLATARLAGRRGGLSARDLAEVERFSEALVDGRVDVGPPEPPARLHGDLWNGNVLWALDGVARVIDPAAYGGHREADLAMLSLFGLPHLPRVLDAYAEVAPLADGWEDRVALHQLFPLLVHACMFGGGYGARAGAVAARYA